MSPVWTLLFVIAATGAGVQLLRWLRLPLSGALERWSFGAPVGLGVAAYGVLALGLVGRLTSSWLAGLVAAIALLGLREGWALLHDSRFAFATWFRRSRQESWVAVAFAAGGFFHCLSTLVAALAPPADLDWDGLSYHLAAPKIYLHEGRIRFIEYDSHTNFPFTVEMLYALGLAWGGAPAAKLFHWAAYCLTGLAVAAWVGRHLSVRALRAWAPPLGAALWLSIPQAIWEAGTAYVDLGTALFQFTALAALTRLMERGADWWRGVGWRGALLGGLLTGWALGTKYTALIQFGALGLALAFAALRARGWQPWLPVAVFGAAAVLVASPWYIKNALWTNNPVYPFLYPLFPNSIHWNAEFHRAYQHEQHSFGRGGDAEALLRLPWDLTFHGRHFFITTPRLLRWDKWAGLGLLVAGFAPLLLFARGLNRRARALLGYVLFSLLVWCFLSKQTRYLLPVCAPLAAVVVDSLIRLEAASTLRRAALSMAGVSVAAGLWLSAQLAAPAWSLLTGHMTHRSFRQIYLPDLAPASDFVNTLPTSARVALLQETRGFYFDRPYFWANEGQHDLIPYARLETGSQLVDYLRQQLGISHILINLSLTPRRDLDKMTWWRLVGQAVQQRRATLVFESRPGESLQRHQGIVILELV